MNKLVIAGREFNSRLFLGTGKFNSNELMAKAIEASQTEMVTVAMKRIELDDQQDDLLTHITRHQNIQLLPNSRKSSSPGSESLPDAPVELLHPPRRKHPAAG